MKNNSNPIPVYRAFGLNIQCELPAAGSFGLAPCGFEIPDAVIQLAPVPTELENPQYKDPFISAASGMLLLKIHGIARYLISDGTKISIAAEPSSKEGDVATYAFGSALGALLYQRNILALHGSAVRTSKGAVIFSGRKGAGKSTTASALSSRGWEFMSDDVCAIHTEGERPMLHPGLSRAKLTGTSYSQILKESPSQEPISPVLVKYGVPFETSREPSELHALCVLETTASEPYIEAVSGTERLSLLINCLYRPKFHELMENPVTRFKKYAKVSSAIRVYRIYRSDDFSQMDKLLNEIEEKILAEGSV